jgi:hypothetical protein
LLLPFAASAFACRTSGQADQARPSHAVGWDLSGIGGHLRQGRLATDPPGEEEHLIPAVPTASLAWVNSCAEPGRTYRGDVELSLTLASDGTVRQAEPADVNPIGRCIARVAARDRLNDVHLKSTTRVALRLTFAR